MQIVSDFRQLFNRQQKRRYLLLQMYFLLAAAVQVVSVASIAPFIAILSDPGLIHRQRFLAQLYANGGFTSDRSFLIAFALLLMAVIAIGNVVPAVTGYLSWVFVRRLGTEIQSDVYRGFMYGDLARAARMNTAQMTNVVTQGVNRLSYNVVLPVLSLVSSGVIILLISIGLVVYDPVVAVIAAAIVGGSYFGIFNYSKKRLTHHGSVSWIASEAKQRIMTESLRGIKEVRLAGAEPLYEARLHDLTARAMDSEAKVGLFSDLPRYALETIALCAVLGLGIFLLMRNDDWASIVATLTVYAMAGYRLLPAAQIAFKSAVTVRANVDVVRDISSDVRKGRELLRDSDTAVVTFPTTAPILVESLSFRYPGEERDVLEEINLNIPRNQVTALVGQSGAGKSTLADLLLGLMQPTSGTISVAEVAIAKSPRSWHRSVALVSQTVFLFDDTIEANIAFGSADAVDNERLYKAAQMANALPFIEQLPGGFACGIGEAGGRLSGGQRQRIGIARALYNDADIIVLDEPTSALDSVAEREVMSAITGLKHEKTIILITHRIPSLRDADLIIVLDKGKLAGAGRFDELALNCPPFQSLLETE